MHIIPEGSIRGLGFSNYVTIVYWNTRNATLELLQVLAKFKKIRALRT